jgi:ATP-binding cassette subfamily F protein uup
VLGDGQLRDLPRGVDQYLEDRARALKGGSSQGEKKVSSAQTERLLKKDLARVERQIEKAREKLAILKSQQSEASFDADRLLKIANEITSLESELVQREEEWLEITLQLDS